MIYFSVIIPTYNRAGLITETIETVLQQTYPHFELVIVDDGSTDDTREVVESRYSGDTRIKYFIKENEERGAARNFGLKHAEGDYAVFFDSDDWMKPDYLNTLKNIIDENAGVFLFATKYNYDHAGKEELNPGLEKLSEGWYDQKLFLKGNMLACNFCINIREHKIKYFPEERELASMEDWLFLLLNSENDKVFIRDKVCLTMRQHDQRSMMNNQLVIKARQNATAWILKNLPLDHSDRKMLLAWSHYFCGVHQYLDLKRKEAIAESVKAISSGGLNIDFLILFLKAIVGRRIISWFK
jgi:GalNAc5-diNAcBac-PP-undecaprenol beta-1,3-glucosyltransferase